MGESDTTGPQVPEKKHLDMLINRILPLLRNSKSGDLFSCSSIAREAGLPEEAPIHVGWMLQFCTEAHDTPWWRVIHADGTLPPANDATTTSRAEIQTGLLRQENHHVAEGRVVGFRPRH